MRYTFLLTYLAGKTVYEALAAKPKASQSPRSASTVGVALANLEEGRKPAEPLIMSNPAEALSFLQKLYAVLGPAAWIDYLAAGATPARQYRATHVLFNALYNTITDDDTYEKPHDIFFWATVWLTVIEFAALLSYLSYHRWNNIPHKVSNAYWLTEFLETASAVYGIGSLIQDPTQDGVVSLEDQWWLLAFAFGLACTQMITGIKGKYFFQDTAHNMIEAFGRPDETAGPVSLCDRFMYGILRVLHTTHILTLAYSFSDALTLLFQMNDYLNNPLNALICAVPITFIYLLESRFVLYALYSKKLPSWALNVATLGCCLYALNNALFALNAFAFYIVVDRLKIENLDDSLEFYHNAAAIAIMFVPSILVALAVAKISWGEYVENFYNELSFRAQICGYNQKESDAVLEAFYTNPNNQNRDASISSRVIEFHHEQAIEETNILMALTGPLVLSEARSSTVFRPSEAERDTLLSVNLSEDLLSRSSIGANAKKS